MHFSEQAVINLSHGINFRTDSLRAVGIYDGSRCWGLWVPEVTKDDNGISQVGEWDACAKGISGLGRFHLVISPFHPASWPYLIRLQFSLADRPGALRDAAEFLSENSINILFQQQAPAGFSHAIWTVIGEAVDVREAMEGEKQRLDDNLRQPDRLGGGQDTKDLIKFAQDTGERMAAKCRDLETQLEKWVELIKDKSTDPDDYGFLYHRVAKGTQLLFTPGGKQDASQHFEAPYSVTWLTNLAFFSIFGGGAAAPYGMRYELKNKFIRFDQDIDVPARPGEWIEEDASYASIVSFDAFENFVRVMPIPEKTRVSRSVLLSLRYEAKARGRDAAGLTRGLLYEVAAALAKSGVDILSLLNKTTSYEFRRRSGKLRFIGLLDRVHVSRRDVLKQLEDRINQIVARNREEGGQGAAHPRDDSGGDGPGGRPAVTGDLDPNGSGGDGGGSGPTDGGVESRGDGEVGSTDGSGQANDKKKRVRPEHDSEASALEFSDLLLSWPRLKRVFVSMRFNLPRDAGVRAAIDRVAARLGVQRVFSEAYSKSATGNVIEDLKTCDAFMQILTDPKMGGDAARWTWMDFEYGVAAGLELPRIRLIDIASKSRREWFEQITVDRDHACREVRLDLDDAQIEEAIYRAMAEVTLLPPSEWPYPPSRRDPR